MEVIMTIGDRVKYIRKINQMNQKNFSDQIGISQGTLSEIESNKCSPSFETLVSLGNKFGCDFNWLLLGDSAHTEINHTLSRSEIVMIELYRKLDDDDQIELLEIFDLKLKMKNRKKEYK